MKPKTETAKLNKLVDAAFRALDRFRHSAAMLGTPIRSISLSVDAEGDVHGRVRYFRMPKTAKACAKLRQ